MIYRIILTMVAQESDIQILEERYGILVDPNLLCWEHGIMNAVNMLCKDSVNVAPHLVFVKKNNLDQTFLVLDGIVYNEGVTWPGPTDWNKNYSLDELIQMVLVDEAIDITKDCLESQFEYLKNNGGNQYWRPVRQLDQRLSIDKVLIVDSLDNYLHNGNYLSFLEKYSQKLEHDIAIAA